MTINCSTSSTNSNKTTSSCLATPTACRRPGLARLAPRQLPFQLLIKPMATPMAMVTEMVSVAAAWIVPGAAAPASRGSRGCSRGPSRRFPRLGGFGRELLFIFLILCDLLILSVRAGVRPCSPDFDLADPTTWANSSPYW